jgi:hypothetical protein
MGWLLLVVLTAGAVFASLAVALRSAPAGRAELGVCAALVLMALIAAPILVLGYTNHLYRPTLAALSAITFGAAFVAACRGKAPSSHARDTWSALVDLARLPFEAIHDAARARSVVLVGLAWALGLLLLAAWLTYLAPAESWDGFFYHEPIVGFAIQTHGFSPVPLPMHETIQSANGYPRLGESLSLWFVIFTDKTFVELPSLLVAPPIALALHAMVRRYTDRVSAMGWAPVFLMTATIWTQLRTTYIDLIVAFFMVAAIYYGTRPELRIRDAACATLALTLYVASKFSALTWVPAVAIVIAVRLIARHARRRPLATVATLIGGAGAMAGVLAVELLRNWRAFHNPIWPMAYTNAALGMKFWGPHSLEYVAKAMPLQELFDVKYGVPAGGVGDLINRDYGYAVPWVVVPFALLGFARALVSAAREIVLDRHAGLGANALQVGAMGIISLATTPSFYFARFNIEVIAVLIVLAAWALSAPRNRVFHQGVLGAATALSIVPLFWTRGWYFNTSFKRVDQLMHAPAHERAYMNSEDFDLSVEIARFREQELGPGARVAIDETVIMPGAYWNFQFSNELKFVPWGEGGGYVAQLDAYGPTWVIVGESSEARKALAARPDRWEYVGKGIAVDPPNVVFRRR